MLTDPQFGPSPMGWFVSLEAAKEALGFRRGIIWKNDLKHNGTGENVYQQA
jgi:hypothetical protein